MTRKSTRLAVDVFGRPLTASQLKAIETERDMLLNVVEDMGMALKNALHLEPALRDVPAVAKPLKRVHKAMTGHYGDDLGAIGDA